MRFRLSIVRSAAIIVLVVGLVAVGSASLRDAVASFRWPSWASTILFLVLLFLIFLAVELPFAYVGGHRWETTSGLSSQSFRGWAKDLAKSVGLGLGGSIVVGSVVLWLLSATPAWWWLVAWVLGVLVSAILGFLAPVLLSRSSIGSGPSLMPPFVVVSKPSRRRPKPQSWACSSCARPRRLGGRTPRSWVSVPRGG